MSFELLNTTAAGAGATQKLNGHILKDHGVQVTFVTSSAVTIDLEGSLDGETWFQIHQRILSAPEIAAFQAIFFNTAPKPVAFVRANLITNTGGGNVIVKYVGA